MQFERPDQNARMSRIDLECRRNHLDCLSIAARLPLECPDSECKNVSNAVGTNLDCRRNARMSRMALRMPSESLDCLSNPVGTSRIRMQERPECTSNESRLPPESISRCSVLNECQLECTSDAVGIFRLLLECGSNAARMQLERPDQNGNNVPNAPRIHLRMAVGIYFDIFGTKRIQLECTSNAVGIFSLPLECSLNVPTRMQ